LDSAAGDGRGAEGVRLGMGEEGRPATCGSSMVYAC
jgi:hypothetical protein